MKINREHLLSRGFTILSLATMMQRGFKDITCHHFVYSLTNRCKQFAPFFREGIKKIFFYTYSHYRVQLLYFTIHISVLIHSNPSLWFMKVITVSVNNVCSLNMKSFFSFKMSLVYWVYICSDFYSDFLVVDSNNKEWLWFNVTFDFMTTHYHKFHRELR